MRIFLDCKGKSSREIVSIAKRNGLPLTGEVGLYDAVDSVGNEKVSLRLWQIDAGNVSGNEFLDLKFNPGLQKPYDTCCGAVTSSAGHSAVGTYRNMRLPQNSSEEIRVIELGYYGK